MRRKSKWKKLSSDQEKMIVGEFINGKTRARILREYEIPEWQFCSIIRNAARVN